MPDELSEAYFDLEDSIVIDNFQPVYLLIMTILGYDYDPSVMHNNWSSPRLKISVSDVCTSYIDRVQWFLSPFFVLRGYELVPVKISCRPSPAPSISNFFLYSIFFSPKNLQHMYHSPCHGKTQQ